MSYSTEAKKRLGFQLIGWVIMPEHCHLLIRPRDPKQSAAQVLRGIKAGFAKIVIARWEELDAPILRRLKKASGGYRFWFPGGGHDRNIFSQAEFDEKLSYIHQNPVARGLVTNPLDWKWSSACWYFDRARYVGPKLDVLT